MVKSAGGTNGEDINDNAHHTKKRSISDLFETNENKNLHNIICESVFSILQDQPLHVMNRKTLRKSISKSQNINKSTFLKSVFEGALDYLECKKVTTLDIDDDVTLQYVGYVHGANPNKSHKKSQVTTETFEETSDTAASHSLTDTILIRLSRQQFTETKPLRSEVLSQLIPSNNNETHSQRKHLKKQFASILAELIDSNQVVVSELGLSLVAKTTAKKMSVQPAAATRQNSQPAPFVLVTPSKALTVQTYKTPSQSRPGHHSATVTPSTVGKTKIMAPSRQEDCMTITFLKPMQTQQTVTSSSRQEHSSSQYPSLSCHKTTQDTTASTTHHKDSLACTILQVLTTRRSFPDKHSLREAVLEEHSGPLPSDKEAVRSEFRRALSALIKEGQVCDRDGSIRLPRAGKNESDSHSKPAIKPPVTAIVVPTKHSTPVLASPPHIASQSTTVLQPKAAPMVVDLTGDITTHTLQRPQTITPRVDTLESAMTPTSTATVTAPSSTYSFNSGQNSFSNTPSSTSRSLTSTILQVLSQQSFPKSSSLRHAVFSHLHIDTSLSRDKEVQKSDFKAALTELVEGNKIERTERGVIRLVVASNVKKEGNDQVSNDPHEFGTMVKPRWTAEEEAILIKAVNEHISFRWNDVARLLNKSVNCCRMKYAALINVDSNRKHGKFTMEEDEVIRTHVIEHGGEISSGFWDVIADKLNRIEISVRNRWQLLRNGGTTLHVVWTDEMNTKLIEGQSIYGSDWIRVARFIGSNVTNAQCAARWNKQVCPAMSERIKGPFSEQEVNLLKTLVPKYTAKSKDGVIIKWKELAVELNRKFVDCQRKWTSMLSAQMKHGPFTTEEDSVIKQRVFEWGNKGNGLWMLVSNELDRPPDAVSGRYLKYLKNT